MALVSLPHMKRFLTVHTQIALGCWSMTDMTMVWSKKCCRWRTEPESLRNEKSWESQASWCHVTKYRLLLNSLWLIWRQGQSMKWITDDGEQRKLWTKIAQAALWRNSLQFYDVLAITLLFSFSESWKCDLTTVFSSPAVVFLTFSRSSLGN